MKMYIDGTEVLCDKDITITEEVLSTPSIILNNVFPKTWDNDKDYTSRFYFPKDYSKFTMYDEDSNLIFAGVVKNTGNINLNPRYPHYATLQVLDFKTFLSEGETLDFVISDKTILEAINMVIENIQSYGFALGNVDILNGNDIIGAYNTQNQTANDVRYICKISNNNTTLNCETITPISNYFTDMRNVHYITTGGLWSSYKSYSEYTISPDVGYVMIGATGDTLLGDMVAKYKVIKINGNNASVVYTAQGEPDSYDIPMRCNLINLNGTMFTNFYWNLETLGSHLVYDFKTAIILDNWVNDVALASTDAGMLDKFHLFDIRNVFNLYTAYYLGEDSDSSLIFLNKSNIIYYPTNSNGLPFIYYNSLTPEQMLLYDDDGIIFARNLYNKTIYNNITESTVEIPNTLLNDTTISNENLLGKTNYVLSQNDEEIEKNIYETLYINVFNKLNVINKNEPNNPIINLNGATKINASISNNPDETEYNNAKIGKVRVNYKNGTSYTKNIISSTITNNVADIQFQLTIISDILNIEILSNDENTIYQTITGDYEIGKTYTISQKCHVE